VRRRNSAQRSLARGRRRLTNVAADKHFSDAAELGVRPTQYLRKMKLALIGFLVLVSCDRQDRPRQSETSEPPSADSGQVGSRQDSILDRLGPGGTPAVLANGDTVINYGGGILSLTGAQNYAVDHYRIGATHYVRIQRAIGRKANGKPIWLTRARLRLPPMDSTETIVLTEGMCAVNGKNDPSVFGITGTVGDSVRWHAHHAWRFDLAAESLQEIPTAGVTCEHADGED